MSNFMEYRPTFSSGYSDPIMKDVIEEYRKSGKHDNETLELCSGLEGFVITMINKRFSTYKMHWDDLYEAAMLAIADHASEYSPEKGTKTTWCRGIIMHDMFDWIAENVMMGTRYYGLCETKINRALRDLDKPDAYSPEEIYDMLDGKISIKAIRKILKLKQDRLFAKTVVIESADWIIKSYADTIPAYYDPDDFEKQKELGENLICAVDSLSKHERSLIINYYGLNNKTPMPAKVLAKKYGKTQKEIMGELTMATKKLRQYMDQMNA